MREICHGIPKVLEPYAEHDTEVGGEEAGKRSSDYAHSDDSITSDRRKPYVIASGITIAARYVVATATPKVTEAIYRLEDEASTAIITVTATNRGEGVPKQNLARMIKSHCEDCRLLNNGI